VSKDLVRSSEENQEKRKFMNFFFLVVMSLKTETTFSLLQIPALVKSKNIFCHYVQILMGILEICEQTFFKAKI
jgi:hypothetical protein